MKTPEAIGSDTSRSSFEKPTEFTQIAAITDAGTTKRHIDELAAELGVNQTRLMWKIDICLVPSVCLLYLLAFLDRVNVSNAKIYGMAEDLNLTGNQFNVALTIFFVPYIIFELVSNYLLKKFKPHVWLSACIFLFGVITIGVGFIHNYGSLLALRFLLGIFESGMFPGCFYLLSMWYRRDEAQKRYSFFFASTNLAGAFGGLIAYGINNLNMKHGIEGWRWIFIIEGSITCGCAFFLFFTLADFPEDAKYLKENERIFLKRKLALDVGESKHEVKFTWKEIAGCFKDVKIWLAALAYFGMIIPAYGYAYFAPSIVKTFGYSAVQTQLKSVFPWICGFGFSMVVATFSDFIRHKFGLFLGCCGLGIIGFGILLGDRHDNVARYAACFLITSGLYTAMPLLICWTSMNFSGHLRRSVGTAWQIGFGNIGGIVATFSFLQEDAPYYLKGFGLGLAFTGFAVVVGIVYFFVIWSDNKKRRNGTEAFEKFESLSERKRELAGDLDPKFVYTY